MYLQSDCTIFQPTTLSLFLRTVATDGKKRTAKSFFLFEFCKSEATTLIFAQNETACFASWWGKDGRKHTFDWAMSKSLFLNPGGAGSPGAEGCAPHLGR
jgi:hypothetical protein